MAQARGEAVYLIAWAGDVPVGYVFVKLVPSSAPAHEEACAELEDLFVAEDRRSRGIGTRLALEAEAIARDRGHSKIGLSVGVENTRAERLYRRLGYLDTRHREFTNHWTYVDDEGVDREGTEICNYMVKLL
jgi:ribosomal protein S18 acetylase RimI-like enzyme